MKGTRLGLRWHERLWRTIAAIAMGAQVVFATVGLVDVHGVGASAHVEAAGIHQHYAHNEATCVACTMAALSAIATPGVALVARPVLPPAVRVARYTSPAARPLSLVTQPRAPPGRR